MPKRTISFAQVFGATPQEWFLSCQQDRTIFRGDGTIGFPQGMVPSAILFEKSKGTVFHFRQHFPDNPVLTRWAEELGRVR